MNLSLIFSKLGISQDIAQDVTLLLTIVLASFIFGMLIGRYRIVSILINIYISFAIVTVIPEKFFEDYTLKLIFFLGIIVSLALFNRRLFEVYFTGSGSGFLWRVFAMSFLEVMLLLSITLSFLPKKIALGYVSAKAFDYLAFGTAPLIWMVIPIVFLIFVHKRLNR